MVAGARRSRWPSRSSGASSTEDDRDADPRPGHRHRPTCDALADCDLVIESVVEDLAVKKAALRRARRRSCKADGDPRHQHLDPAGRRAGDGDRAARPGLRHPLLQPGADDVAGRDRPPAHRQRRDDRRGHGVRRRRAARTPVEVKDRAGFIVNALLFPYLNNAVRMLETRHGVDATTSTPR